MKTNRLTLISLFTAILCILGPLSILLPFSPIPVSLGTLGIFLMCLLLGPKNGFLCTFLYLILGSAGLPVFSGFTGGIGKLLGPGGGYLVGYLLLAFIGGYLAGKWKKSLLLRAAGLCIGTFSCYLLGSIWLAFQTNLGFYAALWTGVIPYVPFDIAKIIAALLLEQSVRKRLRLFDYSCIQ